MLSATGFSQKDKLISYSSAFSRRAFTELLEKENFSGLSRLYRTYGSGRKRVKTYRSYLKHLYQVLKDEYRCEYVYKTEVIKFLIQEEPLKSSVIFNEFRLPNTIVDLVMFNGSSRAYEIKTEYDSPRRLKKQLETYTSLFQKTYLVILETLLSAYLDITPQDVGIVVLSHSQEKGCHLDKYREAETQTEIDPNLLMKVLHTQEYKDIVLARDGKLPSVSSSKMYDACFERLKEIPSQDLHDLFIKAVKKRKNNTQMLKKLPEELKQIALQLRLSEKQVGILLGRLDVEISKHHNK